ncbi:MAG: DUF3343 domain-containing protein [Thermovirgaceae bacterium]|nr:DUF3343 domain-containing protein [Thermovirgaceae bacterium]
MDCIATFETTHMAILFEKTCKKEGLSVKIVPVPRNISASCGLACRFRMEDEPRVRELASDNSIEVLQYHLPPACAQAE